MIKRGDILSIALILANVVFVCLFLMKGTVTTSSTFMENDGSDLVASPLPTIMPAVTAQPSPTMVLAVNEGALLFAEIRSQPHTEPAASSTTPTPTSTPTPTVNPTVTPAPSSAPEEVEDDNVPQEPKPSYKTILDAKPNAKEVPSHYKASKPHPKH